MVQLYLFLPVGIQVEIGPQYPLFFVEKDKMSGPSDETGIPRPESQQVWHDKEPCLLKGHIHIGADRGVYSVYSLRSTMAMFLLMNLSSIYSSGT